MKITNKRIETDINFQDIEWGEVFVYEGEIYMKADGEYDCDGESYNAIYLTTGEICHFGDWDRVIRPIKVVPMEVHW